MVPVEVMAEQAVNSVNTISQVRDPVSHTALAFLSVIVTNPAPLSVVSPLLPMKQFSNLVAAEMDFGGYAGPAGSLLFIAAIIVTLAPPPG